MSLLGKEWQILNPSSNQSALEKIITSRQNILLSDTEEYHNPYDFTDMYTAIKRITQAIDNHEKIIVFGDYDVDGISGTALLYQTLKELNAQVSYRIPNRMKHGYGLTMPFIEEFIEKKIDLIITVDCGISCFNEVTKAKEHHIDIIITDHHTIPENVPPATAIIHPKYDNNYPYQELTGSGVAFKLAQALIKELLPTPQQEGFLNSLVDLASLGTVSDMGPLNGENRLIVKRGLKSLSQTKWPGLKQLLLNSDIKPEKSPTAGDIGFKIGPRINAAGRIDDPYIALQLLLQNENQRIQELGQALEKINSRRIEMVEQALKEASEVVLKLPEPPPIIIIESTDWHVGILGLIASKIADKYHRPAIVLQEFDDFLSASARSPEYFNIIEALTDNSQYLQTFGGHHCAAGFKISKDNYSEFKKAITDYAQSKISTIPCPILKVDCEINPEELTLEFEQKLSQLEPFGIGNSRPKLLLKKVSPQFIQTIGHENKHLKFLARNGKREFSAIGFNMGNYLEDIKKSSLIDIVFSTEINHWQGNSSLQLHIHDISLNN